MPRTPKTGAAKDSAAPTPESSASAAETGKAKAKRAAPLSQADVPAYSLTEALRVPETLRDEFAKQTTSPLELAVALDMSPSSGPYKMLTGAAVAYGLTEGAAQASSIGLTELGLRAVSPTEEGADLQAYREAVLKPRVIREFLEKYNGSPLPTNRQIALNVIEQMGVPQQSTERAYDMIVSNAEALGLLIEHKGKKYVRLEPSASSRSLTRTADSNGQVVDQELSSTAPSDSENSYDVEEAPSLHVKAPTDPVTNNRVFITHGQNHKVVEQIRKILTFGKFEAVVSIDQQTVAKPISDKVMDDMRTCSAAIVHVGAERKLIDENGDSHTVINPNVLIEIGAAMALYNRRFVLLVERGVELPSNLHGLYEVKYEGEQLDHEATMKLLEAFNDFR
jgi:predicted nucleotide-binding protein